MSMTTVIIATSRCDKFLDTLHRQQLTMQWIRRRHLTRPELAPGDEEDIRADIPILGDWTSLLNAFQRAEEDAPTPSTASRVTPSSREADTDYPTSSNASQIMFSTREIDTDATTLSSFDSNPCLNTTLGEQDGLREDETMATLAELTEAPPPVESSLEQRTTTGLAVSDPTRQTEPTPEPPPLSPIPAQAPQPVNSLLNVVRRLDWLERCQEMTASTSLHLTADPTAMFAPEDRKKLRELVGFLHHHNAKIFRGRTFPEVILCLVAMPTTNNKNTATETFICVKGLTSDNEISEFHAAVSQRTVRWSYMPLKFCYKTDPVSFASAPEVEIVHHLGHSRDRSTQTYAGALLKTERGQETWISSVGGLVNVDGTFYLLTGSTHHTEMPPMLEKQRHEVLGTVDESFVVGDDLGAEAFDDDIEPPIILGNNDRVPSSSSLPTSYPNLDLLQFPRTNRLQPTVEGADWRLFECDSDAILPNTMSMPYTESIPQRSSWYLSRFAGSDPKATRVLINAGVTGVTPGFLLDNPSFILSAGSVRETWSIQLNAGSNLARGDSGSWVIDTATSEILGSIVAISPSHAYMTPIHQVLDDIASKFGANAPITAALPFEVLVNRAYHQSRSNRSLGLSCATQALGLDVVSLSGDPFSRCLRSIWTNNPPLPFHWSLPELICRYGASLKDEIIEDLESWGRDHRDDLSEHEYLCLVEIAKRYLPPATAFRANRLMPRHHSISARSARFRQRLPPARNVAKAILISTIWVLSCRWMFYKTPRKLLRTAWVAFALGVTTRTVGGRIERWTQCFHSFLTLFVSLNSGILGVYLGAALFYEVSQVPPFKNAKATEEHPATSRAAFTNGWIQIYIVYVANLGLCFLVMRGIRSLLLSGQYRFRRIYPLSRLNRHLIVQVLGVLMKAVCVGMITAAITFDTVRRTIFFHLDGNASWSLVIMSLSLPIIFDTALIGLVSRLEAHKSWWSCLSRFSRLSPSTKETIPHVELSSPNEVYDMGLLRPIHAPSRLGILTKWWRPILMLLPSREAIESFLIGPAATLVATVAFVGLRIGVYQLTAALFLKATNKTSGEAFDAVSLAAMCFATVESLGVVINLRFFASAQVPKERQEGEEIESFEAANTLSFAQASLVTPLYV